MSKNAPKVYVGMSGGVDSSVTAALLVRRGYDVTGVYMKNWSQDLPGMVCPWREDYQDAKRVAVQLGIPFKLYDFQAEYREHVVNYLLDGYRTGITPNPDIMCNQEIKFKLFLETALADGADMIATGHYARIAHDTRAGRPEHMAGERERVAGHGAAPLRARAGARRGRDGLTVPGAALYTAANADKDQTYFLYRVTAEALGKSLMPIGDIGSKDEVRRLAREFGLATAAKKDSQGICFVGKVGIKEFLQQFIEPDTPGIGQGSIVDQHGRTIGEHSGALFYTIGQRHGLDVGGGLPYYVTGKDMARNEVYVTSDLQDPALWSRQLRLSAAHWINEPPSEDKLYFVRTRYRAPLVKCTISRPGSRQDNWIAQLDEDVRAVTPGQSAVLYEPLASTDGQPDSYRVIGGGVAA